MVHPAAVSDTLVRNAAASSYRLAGDKSAADPGAVALWLRAACALWRASPNDEVRDRQLQQVRHLVAALRGLSKLDEAGKREHWGPADGAATLGAGEWSAQCTWSDSNKLFGGKPKAHCGTAAVTAAAGHALLDAHEVFAGLGDLDASAEVRGAAESAAEWLVEDCGHVQKPAGIAFRWATGMQHQLNHASAAAAGFLARAGKTFSRDTWVKLAVAAVPALHQGETSWDDAAAFPVALEYDSTLTSNHPRPILDVQGCFREIACEYRGAERLPRERMREPCRGSPRERVRFFSHLPIREFSISHTMIP